MKLKLIREVSALPKEFRSTKYRALNPLKPDGWYQVISTRFNLNRRIQSSKINANNLENLANEVLELLDNPVSTIFPEIEGRHPETLSSLLDRSVNEFGIRPINFFTAFSIAQNKKRFGRQIEAFERYLDAEGFSSEDRDLLRQPICLSDSIFFEGRSFDVPVDVCLALPDEILIKEFKSWLKTIRRELKIFDTEGQGKQSNVISDVTIGLVKMSKAIPYIDLRLWAMCNGFRISPEVFTDALELDDVKRLENTKKWVSWVLNPRTTDALFGECASKLT